MFPAPKRAEEAVDGEVVKPLAVADMARTIAAEIFMFAIEGGK